MITTLQFALLFAGYAIASIVLHFAVAFTIAAAILYGFTLLPFYLLCLAYVVSWAVQHRGCRVRVRRWLLPAIAIAQAIVLLSSPASCYGFKQGAACYSLLQAWVEGDAVRSLAQPPAHWSVMDPLFYLSLFSYGALLVAFLATLRPVRSA